VFRIPKALLLAGLLCPLAVGALEPQQFKIRTANELVDICAVGADDPKVTAAIHFCHGYGIGAWGALLRGDDQATKHDVDT